MKEQFQLEKRFVRPDGSIRWANVEVVRTSPPGELPALNMATVQDITDRRESDEALRESESRARQHARDCETLFDAVPVPVFIAREPSCHYITTNRAGIELLRLGVGGNASLSSSDGEKLPFRFLRDGIELPAPDLPMQRAGATGKAVIRSPLQVKFDNGALDVLVDAAPLIGESGAVEGVVGAFIDITERKEAEKGHYAPAKKDSDLWCEPVHRSPGALPLTDNRVASRIPNGRNSRDNLPAKRQGMDGRMQSIRMIASAQLRRGTRRSTMGRFTNSKTGSDVMTACTGTC